MNSKPAQQHKIMRQVLEVRGCARADTQRIQSDIRAAYDRLLPSIERTCSELSTPARLQRIDRLEIDLGEVPPDALESAVVERFDRVFASRLAAALGAAESTQVDVDLELFSYFIRTGTVPWWADHSDRRLLETRLDAAIRRAPRAVRRAIEHAPNQNAVWRRIALACSDRLLDDLLVALAPQLAAAWAGLGTQWLALIEIAMRGQGRLKPVVRTLWWEELLRAAYSAAAPVSATPRFFGAILVRLASRLGLDYTLLVANLRGTLDHPDLSTQSWAREVVERLHRDALTAAGDSPASRPQPGTDHNFSEGTVNADASTDRADVELERLLADLPPAERARALARIRRTPASAALLRKSAASLRGLAAPSDSRGQDVFALEGHSDKNDPLAPVDLAFSDIDEVYVENAGLVILWPFLENFFRHLDLIEGKQFRDPAARQRAVGLLQYVAAEEDTAPEYLVPLNKVLCGMPMDDVFDFGPAVTAVEIEACTDLIAAAIHHAPILRDMSIQGFRGSFLLRRGQLGVRDGSWWLRVERETHDIVLDRFPWNVAIVKLPWMPAIMPVEWQR